MSKNSPHSSSGAEENDLDLESQYLRGVLTVTLTKPVLYFKKHEIYKEDKQIMLKHLQAYGKRILSVFFASLTANKIMRK